MRPKNGGNIGNNVAIPGDPGASGRFNFVATLNFPASMFPVATLLVTFSADGLIPIQLNGNVHFQLESGSVFSFSEQVLFVIG
ncbi:hypothetical protein NXW91_19945 [Bacteroides fragilis]|nr:hypothetical protein [Bacteroides fragilis]